MIPPADRVKLVGLNVAVGPDGETMAESLMIPPKPLTLLTRIVELPEEPAGTLIVAGLSERLNPLTMRITVTVCLSGALVPVTVMVKRPVAPDATDTVKLTEPPEVRVTLVGLSVTDGPLGETEDVKAIVPAKPVRLLRVVLNVLVVPA
jgi:hypothetical protein